MKPVIVFAVLTILSYLFYLLFSHLSEDAVINEKECQGIITKVIVCETGNIMFYISFLSDDNIEMEGQSIHYIKTYNKYKIGDLVDIQYRVISKGRAQVAILDSELVTCSYAVKKAARNMLIIGEILLLITVACIIKLLI